MNLKAGIVGLPNVGKSTLFSAITNSQVEIANYPFATIEPNTGIVQLEDERLTNLAKMVQTKKTIHATFEFVDIAGLVKGASQGLGLGNKFLGNIRETHAIIHVVRCFEDKDIVNTSSKVDPVEDIQIINLELIFADLESLKNILSRVEKRSQNDKNALAEVQILQKAKSVLEDNKLLSQNNWTTEEFNALKLYQFITLKPMLLVGNFKENELSSLESNVHYNNLINFAKEQNFQVLPICAKVEYEISKLSNEDKEIFLSEYNLTESGLNKLARASFQLLNLATYFTVGVQETRAWTFKLGMNAAQCAGIIHTDFEKGFIRAEVINYEDFIAFNGQNGAKENGKMRLEGKDYLPKDGDIMHFRFNV